MREVIIDEASFDTADQVHAFLATMLGFPAHYGANLDALNDCLGDVDESVAISVYLADKVDNQGEYALWFPKLVRSLLRAAKNNEVLEVLVHAGTFSAFKRLADCRGMAELLENDEFITQAVVACLNKEDELS